MNQKDAEDAARTFQACRWNVVVDYRLVTAGNPQGYALKGRAANGNGWVYGFSHNDMKVLVLGGQVASLP